MADFSHDEVIKRTARHLGKKPDAVAYMLSVYANEYVIHARETDPALIQPMPPVKVEQQPARPPAKKATTPRKSRAKATTSNGKAKASEVVSEGNALIDAQVRREAEASVALDRDQTHVVG